MRIFYEETLRLIEEHSEDAYGKRVKIFLDTRHPIISKEKLDAVFLQGIDFLFDEDRNKIVESLIKYVFKKNILEDEDFFEEIMSWNGVDFEIIDQVSDEIEDERMTEYKRTLLSSEDPYLSETIYAYYEDFRIPDDYSRFVIRVFDYFFFFGDEVYLFDDWQDFFTDMHASLLGEKIYENFLIFRDEIEIFARFIEKLH